MVLTVFPQVNYLIQDGKSHWLEGVLLMTMYLLIALASWYVRVCMHILVLPGDVIDTLTGNKMKTGSIQLKLEALPDTLSFFFFFFFFSLTTL